VVRRCDAEVRINAEGEQQAAEKLVEAGKMLAPVPMDLFDKLKG
jgi:hypothetical protein